MISTSTLRPARINGASVSPEARVAIWPATTVFGMRRLPLPTEWNGYRSLLQITGVRAAFAIARKWLAKPSARSQLTLEATQGFAVRLARVRSGAGEWPRRWPGNEQNVSAFLAELVVNRGSDTARAPIDHLVPNLQADVFHGFPSARPPLRSGHPWEALRQVADPSIRRAVFWVAVRTVMPAARVQMSGCDGFRMRVSIRKRSGSMS